MPSAQVEYVEFSDGVVVLTELLVLAKLDACIESELLRAALSIANATESSWVGAFRPLDMREACKDEELNFDGDNVLFDKVGVMSATIDGVTDLCSACTADAVSTGACTRDRGSKMSTLR